MKSTLSSARTKLFLLFVVLISGFNSFAQDGGSSSTESNSTVNHSTISSVTTPDASAMWYNNPMVWVGVGVLVLALILVAATRGRSTSGNSVSRSTTTTTRVSED